MTDDVLSDLAARKKKIVDGLFIDVKVDHWDDDGDPPVYVRYAPVAQKVIDDAQEAAAKAKDTNGQLEANADVLLAACRGVYQKINGKPVGFDGTEKLPKFDHELAKVLGIPGDPPPTMVCRSLFLVEGNLLAHVAAVATFSGQKLAEVDTKLLGE